MKKAKIVDILVSSGYGQNHYYVIFDRKLKFSYEEVEPNFFRAEDSGVYRALGYTRGSKDAFGGTSFEIDMVDGTKRLCKGDHWDVSCRVDNAISVGVSDMKSLSKCYVFTGGTIDKVLVDDWLSKNVHKKYQFYDKYPNYAQVLEARKKWKDENDFFHYAETTHNIDRTHSLIQIEKKIESLNRNLDYVKKDRDKNSDVVKTLLNHLLEEYDLTLDELDDTFKDEFCIYDYIEPEHGYYDYY